MADCPAVNKAGNEELVISDLVIWSYVMYMPGPEFNKNLIGQ